MGTVLALVLFVPFLIGLIAATATSGGETPDLEPDDRSRAGVALDVGRFVMDRRAKGASDE